MSVVNCCVVYGSKLNMRLIMVAVCVELVIKKENYYVENRKNSS